MNLKSIAAIAATLVASSAFAAGTDAKCGAGSCSKKEIAQKDANCSKKDSSCSKKEASCSKKEASCSKKEASCSKKDASCSKKDEAGTSKH